MAMVVRNVFDRCLLCGCKSPLRARMAPRSIRGMLICPDCSELIMEDSEGEEYTFSDTPRFSYSSLPTLI
jgi:hypothetical protein